MSIPRTSTLALALMTALATGHAQNKVVPPHLTSVEGSSFFDLPYVYNAGRYQQIWEGPAVCAGTALINQLSFRRDTDNKTAYAATTFPNTTVRLGFTPVTPAAMSTTFATNLAGATMTTILNGVSYSLPAQPALSSVAPFNVHYPTTTPFLFQRSQGNLMLEIVHAGQATSKALYTLDGEAPSAAAGYVRPFGSFGRFSGGDTPTFTCDAAKLIPGGAIALSVTALKQAYTAAAFFGFSNALWNGIPLPLDLGILGAPSNTLYTGRVVEVALPVVGSTTGYAGAVSLPLPTSNAFAGYRIFAQTWFADAAANALGVVTSNGLELTAGTGNPYTRLLGASDGAATTGFFEKGNSQFGGPVVLLSGAIN
ncbi:MAG: hypothetical protein KDC87_06095 [Planctomycetes bacterium]|nr:hypothetical protein [Planctomycetota bacterium]